MENRTCVITKERAKSHWQLALPARRRWLHTDRRSRLRYGRAATTSRRAEFLGCWGALTFSCARQATCLGVRWRRCRRRSIAVRTRGPWLHLQSAANSIPERTMATGAKCGAVREPGGSNARTRPRRSRCRRWRNIFRKTPGSRLKFTHNPLIWIAINTCDPIICN